MDKEQSFERPVAKSLTTKQIGCGSNKVNEKEIQINVSNASDHC